MSSPVGGGRRKVVAVIGAGECDPEEAAVAYEIGKLLALQDVALVTGGMSGVMEAASHGARDAGGLVIGILPGLLAADANDAVEIAIPSGMGQLRNGLVVNAAGAVSAVGGEWGTLSEIGLALKRRKPVIGWNTWELARGGVPSESITRVLSPRDAVKEALARYAE